MILTLFNQKGGVGKSTIAIALADGFAVNYKTILVDLDKQATLSRLAMAESFHLDVYNVGHVSEIPALPGEVKIVDCPPYFHSQASELFNFSDLVLLPLKPGYGDFFSLSDSVQMVKAAHTKGAIVINMVKPNSGFTGEIRELIESLDFPILATQLGDRVAYGRALMFGSVQEFDPKAVAETRDLVTEVKNQLSDGKEESK